MMRLVRILLLLTTILKLIHLYADGDLPPGPYSVKIKVVSAEDAPLNGASIAFTNSGSCILSDSAGTSFLSLGPGTYTVYVTYIGYEPFDTLISVAKPLDVVIHLTLSSRDLKEVVIQWDRESQAPDEFMSLSPRSVNSIPSLMCEKDPLKALQLLPGIHSVIEGGTGMSVRGGDIDENLILLDQATIYNPSHLLGFFSVFNNDIISDEKVYKGNEPSHYGGRLSSVVEVNMDDGDNKPICGAGEIGLISSKLTLKSSLAKDRFSIAVSGRRSYADLFIPMLKDPDYNQNEIYFYDLYAKASYHFKNHSKVSLSAYQGSDVFRNPWGYSTYGNRMASLQFITGEKAVHSSTAITYSDYRFNMGIPEGGSGSFDWDSGVRESGLKQLFSVKISENQVISTGFQLSTQMFLPCHFSGTGGESFFGELTLPSQQGYEGAVFADHSIKISNRFKLQCGLRYSGYLNKNDLQKSPDSNYSSNEDMVTDDQPLHKEILFGVEPRIYASIRLFKDLWFSGSYCRNRQNVHLAHTSLASNPIDIWFPSGSNVSPEVADQFDLGIDGSLHHSDVSVSAHIFYKNISRALEFQDHTSLFPNGDPDSSLVKGTGGAAGFECRLAKQNGRLNGWISYAYTRSWREFEEINNGNPFPSAYDIPNNLSVVVNFEITPRLVFNAVWVYSTGKPYTAPAGKALINGTVVPIYNSRNGANLPAYHRLDLSLNIKGKSGKKFHSEWTLAVFNAYNRKNVMNMVLMPEDKIPVKFNLTRNYLFPIMPSISYHFEF